MSRQHGTFAYWLQRCVYAVENDFINRLPLSSL